MVAFFYFVLIYGFWGGFEIATLSLAMTVFGGKVTLGCIFLLCFNFGFGGDFEIATLSLAMTVFF